MFPVMMIPELIGASLDLAEWAVGFAKRADAMTVEEANAEFDSKMAEWQNIKQDWEDSKNA